jgi:prevent-host-death family protein
MEVSVYAAKTNLSKLLARVEGGGDVVITRSGRPVARLVPVRPDAGARVLGLDTGRGWIAPDFDAPLPDDVLEAFER